MASTAENMPEYGVMRFFDWVVLFYTFIHFLGKLILSNSIQGGSFCIIDKAYKHQYGTFLYLS